MKLFHHIQMRFPAEEIHVKKAIHFQGVEYVLGDVISQTLKPDTIPIGAIINGFTRQYQLLCGGKVTGAAWFYFYSSFEGDSWAVLDELSLT